MVLQYSRIVLAVLLYDSTVLVVHQYGGTAVSWNCFCSTTIWKYILVVVQYVDTFYAVLQHGGTVLTVLQYFCNF